MTVITPVKQNPHGIDPTRSGTCPACGGVHLEPFFRIDGVPTNSCLNLDSADEARDFPRGTIDLAFCHDCGFMWNRTFDPKLTEYSGRYEATQAYSPTFNAFQRTLAERLVEGFDLQGKRLVEIGCGHGEFCHLLAALGGNHAIGYDPAAEAIRTEPLMKGGGKVDLVTEYFSRATTRELTADAVLTKMTLEHVPAVDTFLAEIADVAQRSEPGMGLYIQVPECERILETCAFWDIYYEHCSYFTPLSLVKLIERHGFEVHDVTREYGDQYLAVFGRYLGEGRASAVKPDEMAMLEAKLEAFKVRARDTIGHWRRVVAERKAAGKTIAVWGSGSKGVSFLKILETPDHVDVVVDINPHRQGKFMIGTGHAIVGPQHLAELKPDTVVIMNPVYRDEIAGLLAERGLAPEILALD